MLIENRLTRVFAEKKGKLLAIFLTAGFPEIDSAISICRCLQEAGVDIIELGFPFSDSLVDGPTIQQCNVRALANGMTLQRYFDQINEIRREVSVPLVAMTCLNPLLSYGMEQFCATCRDIGIDGAIIADLPIAEYAERYRAQFEAAQLSNICLVTSRTDEARLRSIDELSSGFLYAVSSDSTTGSRISGDARRDGYFQRLSSMRLRNPVMVGFGITDRASFEEATRFTHGGIVGSAFLRALGEGGDSRDTVHRFVGSVRGRA